MILDETQQNIINKSPTPFHHIPPGQTYRNQLPHIKVQVLHGREGTSSCPEDSDQFVKLAIPLLLAYVSMYSGVHVKRCRIFNIYSTL